MSIRINGITDALEAAQSYYDSLESEVDGLRAKCLELEREVEDLKEETDILSSEVRDVNACYSELKAEYDNLANLQINDL